MLLNHPLAPSHHPLPDIFRFSLSPDRFLSILGEVLLYLLFFSLFTLVDYVFYLPWLSLSCPVYFSFPYLNVWIFHFFTFDFVVLSRVPLYCIVDFVNYCDLSFIVDFVWVVVTFFVCVELGIKCFSLVALSYCRTLALNLRNISRL